MRPGNGSGSGGDILDRREGGQKKGRMSDGEGISRSLYRFYWQCEALAVVDVEIKLGIYPTLPKRYTEVVEI